MNTAGPTIARRIVLRNRQAPGDILMLTAALRDLHKCYPGEFLTDVRTSCSEIWLNNPYLTALATNDPAVRLVDCEYPLIHRSNEMPVHFLHGFIDNLNNQLGLKIALTEFKGDVHLSPAEKWPPSPVEQMTGHDLPYWIVVAGGKYDYTIKWWHFRRYQSVIDQFRGKLLFVQVGDKGDYHPPLEGVLDFRGKTSLRDLARLVYHARGVLCGVTFLMHLAAAVECKHHRPTRPCVVVAGGRESPHWEAYPHHQFIHTVGTLPCCAKGGCWRSRIVPLGDGDDKDEPKNLCVDVVGGLPRCMDLISAEDVASRVAWYLRDGDWLTAEQERAVVAFLSCRRRSILFRNPEP